jgi:ABC-2 type transport system permease protein
MQREFTLTRGHLGLVGSFIGIASLIFGIIAFIWQGALTDIVIAFLLIGALGVVLWAVATPQDFVGFITGRQTRQSTIAFFSTMLFIGIVTFAYILVQRQAILADMTIDSRFTLSEQTLEVLRTAQRSAKPIQITGFYYPTEIAQRTVDDQYFQLYEQETNGFIQRVYINPIEQPGIAERYMPAIEQGLNIFVSYVNEDGSIDAGSTIIVPNTDNQEQELTQAIAQLLAAGQFSIYFERSLDTLDPIDNGQQGMSLVNNLLRQNGFITNPLSLQTLAENGDSIPQDASAIVIMRPRRQMTDAEITVLDAYLQTGGAVIIGADVFFDDNIFLQSDSSFNQYLWNNYGLRMTDAIVVDPLSSGATELDVISAVVFADNAISNNINLEGQPETRTQFSLARAIDVDDTPPVTNGRVIMSSEVGWGETNYDAISNRNEYIFDENEDVAGPITLVAWAFDEDTGAKVVLVGDGGFASNGQVQAPAGNGLLLLDSLGWMTGFNEAVQFEPKVFVTTPILFVGSAQLNWISLITIILMPGSMLLIAVGIYLRRLRQ